jgi:dTMP kinase
VDLDLLRAATELAIGSCRPTLTILLDLPLDVVNERRAHDAKDRFEKEDLAFHQRVREGYLELAADASWVVLDGSRTEEEVARDVDVAVAHLAW